MKILINCFGSAGDVLPFLSLAREARSRGYRPVIFTNPAFQKKIEGEGIEFVPIGAGKGLEALLYNPRLWTEYGGLPIVMGAAYDVFDETVEALRHHYEAGAIMTGSSLAFPVRCVGIADSVPHATVHLAPSLFVSAHETPHWNPGVQFIQHWPSWVKRMLFSAGMRYIDARFAGPYSRFLQRSGRDRIRGMLGTWWHSPRLTLAMFPEWFAEPQPDWPSNVYMAGFPIYTENAPIKLAPEIERFLAAGDPPVVFAPGSANYQASEFYQIGLEACRLAKRRAILVAPDPSALPSFLPDYAMGVGYTPFHALFPRAAAVVHHAGIGTTSQCFLAGVPQIPTPMAHDQFDNAHRIQMLGCGSALINRKLTAKALAKTINAVIDSKPVSANCANFQQLIQEGANWDGVFHRLEALQ